jgi:predicted nucleotidyltransferase
MKKEIENDLKIVKEKIIKKFKPERIILFGSCVWGGVTKNSDIDLFVKKIINTGKVLYEIKK